MPTNELKTWQAQAQAQTELLLARLMPSENQLPQSLHETMRYAALDGGKRLRPLLVLAASELGEAVPDAVEAAMAAIELIHVYSLVHDDMPAMDNDSLRRGRPTCHLRYGVAAALLAGDALQTLAFDLLSRPTALPPQRQLHMLSTLARSSGSLGMAGGQAIDLANVGRNITQSELEQMHSLKTGALIRAAAPLGGLRCPDLTDNDLQRLDRDAARRGRATLGKTAGKDSDNDKPTYVKLMGLSAARQYAETLVAEALETLEPFGSRAAHLRGLAQFVTARKN